MWSFYNLSRKWFKAAAVIGSVFMHDKLCIKLFTVSYDARGSSSIFLDKYGYIGSSLTAFGSIQK